MCITTTFGDPPYHNYYCPTCMRNVYSPHFCPGMSYPAPYTDIKTTGGLMIYPEKKERGFDAEREKIGTVIRLDGKVWMKVDQDGLKYNNWIHANETGSNDYVQGIFDIASDFEFIERPVTTKREVLTRLIDKNEYTIDEALEDLEYAE